MNDPIEPADAARAGFSLKAARVPYPGTIAAAVTSVLFALGGPIVVKYEAAVLLRGSRSPG